MVKNLLIKVWNILTTGRYSVKESEKKNLTDLEKADIAIDRVFARYGSMLKKLE